MKISLAIAAMTVGLGSPVPTIADVLHQDHITEDTTWSASQGDHIVRGQITVRPGATLTIEPGVTVRGYSEFPFGTIVVRGALEALGTIAEPIVFTRHHATGNWQGLGFDSGAQATFEHCEFRYTGAGIRCCPGRWSSSSSALDSTMERSEARAPDSVRGLVSSADGLSG